MEWVPGVPLRAWLRIADTPDRSRSVRLVYERDGRRAETRLELGSVRSYAGVLLPSFTLALCALLGLLRAAPTPCVRLGVSTPSLKTNGMSNSS